MSRQKGFKHSEETKRKIGALKIGRKRLDVSIRQSINNVSKNPKVQKKISLNRKGKGLGKHNCNSNPEVIKKKKIALLNFYKLHPETLEKKRQLRLKQIEKDGGEVQKGKNETKILDYFEILLGYKIERNFHIIGYKPDGYIPELNLVIEVDEKHHFNAKGDLIKKDIERQNKIINKLNCSFLRIKDV